MKTWQDIPPKIEGREDYVKVNPSKVKQAVMNDVK
jgi:hypothetical protein